MQKKYKNEFGEINGNVLNLFIHNRKQIIKFEDIVKISWVKTQQYQINYIFFLLAVLILFFINNNTLDLPIKVVLLFFSLFLFTISFFFKSFQYTFFLLKKNTFITFNVSRKLRQDAENLVDQYQKSPYSN